MLEIVILIGLCKSIGKRLRAKGWNPLALQIFQVIGWFGGEMLGAFIGVIVFSIINAGQAPPGWLAYAAAIGGGLGSVAVCFTIAAILPNQSPPIPAKFDGRTNQLSATEYDQHSSVPAALPANENPYAVFSHVQEATPAQRVDDQIAARSWPTDWRYSAKSGYGPLRPFSPDEMAGVSYYKARVNRLRFADINSFTGNIFFAGFVVHRKDFPTAFACRQFLDPDRSDGRT